MSDYSDIEEILPPDVSDYGDYRPDMLKTYLPSATEVYQGLLAGSGVLAGVVIGKAVESFLTGTVRAPRLALPFAHAALGVVAGTAVSRWSAPVGVGLAGAFGALAIVRALDIFFNVKVRALSGFDDADISDLADLLEGSDDLLPPELQGFDQVAVEDRGVGMMGQVTASESYAYAG